MAVLCSERSPTSKQVGRGARQSKHVRFKAENENVRGDGRATVEQFYPNGGILKKGPLLRDGMGGNRVEGRIEDDHTVVMVEWSLWRFAVGSGLWLAEVFDPGAGADDERRSGLSKVLGGGKLQNFTLLDVRLLGLRNRDALAFLKVLIKNVKDSKAISDQELLVPIVLQVCGEGTGQFHAKVTLVDARARGVEREDLARFPARFSGG